MRLLAGPILALAVLLCGCQPKQEVPKSIFSGLGKKDLTVGKGVEAVEGDTVWVTYTGTLAKDGTQFDSNDPKKNAANQNPLVFTVGPESGMVEGITKGVIGMKVGGTRKVEVPFGMGYGASASGKIPAYSDLVFNVELLYVVKKGEEKTVDVEDVKIGTGREIQQYDKVTVHYIGKLVNGRSFDDTYQRKQSVSFVVGKGEAITGFEQGILGMKVGGKRRVTIPPAAGWGAGGNKNLPGNQVTVFEVDLLDSKPSGA